MNFTRIDILPLAQAFYTLQRKNILFLNISSFATVCVTQTCTERTSAIYFLVGGVNHSYQQVAQYKFGEAHKVANQISGVASTHLSHPLILPLLNAPNIFEHAAVCIRFNWPRGLEKKYATGRIGTKIGGKDNITLRWASSYLQK